MARPTSLTDSEKLTVEVAALESLKTDQLRSRLALRSKYCSSVNKENRVLWLSSWEDLPLQSLRIGISILATDRKAQYESLQVCCRITVPQLVIDAAAEASCGPLPLPGAE